MSERTIRAPLPAVLVVFLCVGLDQCISSEAADEFPRPKCRVTMPPGFHCADLHEWKGFLERVQRNAQMGFKMDADLYAEAESIVTSWQTKFKEEHPPEGFLKYLCGEVSWPLPNRFCLYGFVAALFIRGRHLMTLTDDTEAKSIARLDLEYAATLFAKESALDFLDSSPWPLSILDLYLNINETDFSTYEKYTKDHPVQELAVKSEDIYWRPPQGFGGKTPKKWNRQLEVAVCGTHATLSLEPVYMLGQIDNGLQISSTFYGLEPKWCDLLGGCRHGAAELSQLLRNAEQDPFAYSWARLSEHIATIYDADEGLRRAELLVCTEPLTACLMLRHAAAARHRTLPVLGYLGVALLNSCPPEDITKFWQHFDMLMADTQGDKPSAMLAVNNLILSEQIFYQTGERFPYVRAHGLYTGAMHHSVTDAKVLVWRAPLFVYATLQCAIGRFLESSPDVKLMFRFVEEREHVPFQEAAMSRAVVLLPWDHALMAFYELYSTRTPLMLPATEWMYRLLYQRGQLSVGERIYQSIRPEYTPPHTEFGSNATFEEQAGHPSPAWGISAAKTARGAAEGLLMRALQAPDLDTAKELGRATMELLQDMRYFLAAAANRTEVEDSATSYGPVRRSRPLSQPSHLAMASAERPNGTQWHPYTPFQMSPPDANDWKRMRKGEWWLRRGTSLDAMRYWYQLSDFARFPGLLEFGSIPEMLCNLQAFDAASVTEVMRQYNEQTLVHSLSFWTVAAGTLLQNAAGAAMSF